MRISGSGKGDSLWGAGSGDFIKGGKGNDFIDGGAGDDTLTGGAGADTFILRSGGGHDVVTDFNPAQGDKVMFDYGTFRDGMVDGPLGDGMSWSNETGTATFTVKATDYNHDGKIDTMITANSDSIVLLGWAPDQLYGSSLIGG